MKISMTKREYVALVSRAITAVHTEKRRTEQVRNTIRPSEYAMTMATLDRERMLYETVLTATEIQVNGL